MHRIDRSLASFWHDGFGAIATRTRELAMMTLERRRWVTVLAVKAVIEQAQGRFPPVDQMRGR